MILITTARAAVLLQRSQRTVLRLIKQHLLTPVLRLPSGDYLLDEADVLALAATRPPQHGERK